MKKLHTKLFTFLLLTSSLAFGQIPSNFEDITLTKNSFYNGSDFKGGFKSGSAFFTNSFDTAFGPYWEGFSVSNLQDDSTPGYENQYSAIAKNSGNYGVFYSNGHIKLDSIARKKTIEGFMITNSTYAYYDMKNGSGFSKKFGGTSGNDPDYFRLVISAWKNGGNPADTSLKVYLADFRNQDNTKDYILKTWQWVDLKPFGNVDSFGFYFESSDTGSFGINTPQYFCMDNFNVFAIGIPEGAATNLIRIFPNPCTSFLTIENSDAIENCTINDLSGRIWLETTTNKVDVQSLPSGIYFLQLTDKQGVYTQKFIKE